MWTRGKDKKNVGKFAYELFGSEGELIERVGGFETGRAADAAAQIAQRKALFPSNELSPEIANMSDDELLNELLN